MCAVFDPYARIAELGLALPTWKSSFDWFERTHQVGDMLFTSGQISTIGTEPVARGRLGAELSVDEGYASAQQAMLNVLGLIHEDTGDLRLWRPARITVYGAVAPDFTELGKCATGASQLLVDVFGSVYGAHARTAVTIPNPANGAAIEVDAIFHRR
ncbi:RidA family protein [Microbacterium sp. YY-01]|uniref:RidA family protein n=1 Tax=Microbacterium sp. YY-01 TaxID=3421634 RepID=UPI003D16E568